MSLDHFQRGLADLTASPELVRLVRIEPRALDYLYDLTPKETRRLAAIAASPGMEANCMLYRANRLAPVALNLPDLCDALGEQLNPLISAYWAAEPTTDVHFLVEADRFCRFLLARPDALPVAAWPALQREHGQVLAKLAASRHWAGREIFKDRGGGSPAYA